MFEIISGVSAASVWRYWDARGGDFFIPSLRWKTRYRNAVCLLVALYCAYFTGLPLILVPIIAVLACANIIVGRTKWEDMVYNGFRFFIGTAVTAAPVIVYLAYHESGPVGAIIYAVSGWLMGPAAYFWTQYDKPAWLEKMHLVDLFQGALIIGGLSYIGMSISFVPV